MRILLPLPLADAYDYSVPEGLDVAPGQFVIVPLGKRETLGVVWGDGTGEVAAAKLRDVIEVLPARPMADALRRFVDWVAAYTLAPPGAVLRMAMSTPSALEAPRTELVYRPAVEADDDTLKLTGARRRVLAALKDGPAMPASELAHLAGVGTSVIKTMASAGLLEAIERTMRRSFPQPDGAREGPTLSPEQKAAAEGLIEKVKAEAFSATLLDGVTGSGKTEVYFEAIAACARRGPAGAGTAAGDRADRAVAQALRGPLRLHAGGVAFGPDQPRAARDLAGDRRGPHRRRGRRALGAVPALPRISA